MKNLFLLISVLAFLSGCNSPGAKTVNLVTNAEELQSAINEAVPGDVITMANGAWKDIEIRFNADGTEQQPITLRAEEAGKVTIEGKSDLKLWGSYLVVDGLHFRNGSSPSSAVIQFRAASDKLAFNSRVTNCVIVGYNKNQRSETDLWVQFHGRTPLRNTSASRLQRSGTVLTESSFPKKRTTGEIIMRRTSSSKGAPSMPSGKTSLIITGAGTTSPPLAEIWWWPTVRL